MSSNKKGHFYNKFQDKYLLTMFSRLESHDNPSRSIHQTPSHVQVLRQHDLKYNKHR